MSNWTRRRGGQVLRAVAISATATALLAGTLTLQAAADDSATATKPATGGVLDRTPGPAPAGFSSWQEVVAEQARLNDVATKIQAAARAAGGDQLGSITADPTERAVRVYWKGALPASVSALVGRLRSTAAVRVLPARYGEQEMVAEARRLAGQQVAGDQITEVTPLPDASGITVGLRQPALSAAPRAAATPAPVASRFRLTFEHGVAPSAPRYDRYHDTSPYFGGGAFSGNNGTCTLGWGVQLAGGGRRLLTAGHCAANGEFASTGDVGHNNGQWVGKVGSKSASQDIELIDPSEFGHSAGGRVFTGGFFTATDAYTSSYNMPVGAWQNGFMGNFVFTSGALSGYLWNIQIGQVGQFIPNFTFEDGTTVSSLGPLTVADQLDHTAAVGNGDSGGPVGMWSADFTHVLPVGTMSLGGGGTETTCRGVPGSDHRTCNWRVKFAPIGNALNYYGAEVLTG